MSKSNGSDGPSGLAPEWGEQLDAYATSGSSPPRSSPIVSLYLTAAEAAAYLRLKVQTVYNLRTLGKLRGVNRGGIKHAPLLFTRAELEEYLRGPRVPLHTSRRSRRTLRKAG